MPGTGVIALSCPPAHHRSDNAPLKRKGNGPLKRPGRSTFKGTGEFMPTPDVAIALGIVTRHASEHIAREAFEHAMRRRKKLTIVHKANVLKMTTGLFGMLAARSPKTTRTSAWRTATSTR